MKRYIIPKWRIDICINLCFHYYFDADTYAEFENIVNLCFDDNNESEIILKFFKREIKPIDKQIAFWLWSLCGRDAKRNFKTQIKRLEKSGYKIVKLK